jgi:hypothetical protein
MTSVIRYVKNTTTAANVNTSVASTGGDYQLIAFDIITTAGIAANANANVLTWAGAGKIKTVLSFMVRTAAGAINVPVAAATTSATGKILNVAVANGGTAITAGSIISMVLVIGNY